MRSPKILGLSLDELTRLSQQAVFEAVNSAVRAGTPVTGTVEGKVQTLSPDDPLLRDFHPEARHEDPANPAQSARAK